MESNVDSQCEQRVENDEDESDNEHDEDTVAASFDFVNDLPRLFRACWELPDHDNEDKLKYWTMFLISIVMMARASEVTTFCPIFEDLELPTPDQQYWDSDGMPKYVYITLRY
jgi:hypothetical protein